MNGRDADGRLVLRHGQVERAVDLIVRFGGVVGRRQAAVDTSGDVVGIGLHGDQANRAAHGARAVERSLRPAEDLDPIDIEYLGIDRFRHGSVVDVKAGRLFVGDAADTDRARVNDAVARVGERQVRNGGSVIEETRRGLLLEGFRAHRSNAERNRESGFGPPRGGHHDIAQGYL